MYTRIIDEVSAAARGLLAVMEEPALGDLDDRKRRLEIALADYDEDCERNTPARR